VGWVGGGGGGWEGGWVGGWVGGVGDCKPLRWAYSYAHSSIQDADNMAWAVQGCVVQGETYLA
jgi:hypothetical protein